jgi:hypothetical protein
LARADHRAVARIIILPGFIAYYCGHRRAGNIVCIR